MTALSDKPVGRVLVACEFSGVVREAFAKLGWDAWSCDLRESEIPGQHYKGDVRRHLDASWDLIIGHPPCTYLCNSGVRWLNESAYRHVMMRDACEFFLEIWNAPCARIAIENPIMHLHAKAHVKLLPAQTIQPYQFGHLESKATCLWLKNLPLLFPTCNRKDEVSLLSPGERGRVHWMPPGEDREMERSRTYSGIAEAMARQWTRAHLKGIRYSSPTHTCALES